MNKKTISQTEEDFIRCTAWDDLELSIKEDLVYSIFSTKNAIPVWNAIMAGLAYAASLCSVFMIVLSLALPMSLSSFLSFIAWIVIFLSSQRLRTAMIIDGWFEKNSKKILKGYNDE